MWGPKSESMDKLEEYYSKICRICLQTEPQMKSLHWDESLPKNSAQIGEVIMACASVQIKENDGLPSHICKRCMCELQASLKFKLLCENSDVELRRHLVKVRGIESTLAAVETPNSQSENIPKLIEESYNDETLQPYKDKTLQSYNDKTIDCTKGANSSLLVYIEKEESDDERFTFDCLENVNQYSSEFTKKREDAMKIIQAKQEDMMKISELKKQNLMKINGELMKTNLKSIRRSRNALTPKN